MPESTSEVTAAPVIEGTCNLTEIKPFDPTPVAAVGDAEAINIETSIVNPKPPISPEAALRQARSLEVQEHNADALKLAELRDAIEPEGEEIAVTMTSAEINEFFRTDRLEDIVADFCQRRLPSIYRIFWGKKVEAGREALGLVPDVDGNRVLKFYFEERNRQDRGQQKSSVESVRKLNPYARPIEPGQPGRVRMVRSTPRRVAENFQRTQIAALTKEIAATPLAETPGTVR